MVTLVRSETTADRSLQIFDARPIELGGFRLRARSAVPVGRPKFDGWLNAMQFAGAAAESAPYWWGDLMRYAESRADWAERLSQALEVSGLAKQTLLNYTSICNRVEEPERRLAPSVGHAAEVAPLPRAEQTKWLESARTEGWTVRDLRLELRAAKRRRIIDGQATLEGMFRLLYADCPWLYNDRPPSGSGAQAHYPGMTIEQLCALPVAVHALPNAAMGFWVTAPMLYEECSTGVPGPFAVIKAWGFTPKTQIIWDKVEHGWGNYVSVRHEILVICTRGSCTPDRPTPMIDSVITARPEPEHSAKPAIFRQTLERLWDGPYLELFASEPVAGWTVFGNDARLWTAAS
jgi:N6-adenosine-specific RNA methylase IME4